MPLYDYECQKCGYVGEFFMNVEDEDLIPCPQKCSGLMKRIFGLGRSSMLVENAAWLNSVLEVVAKDSDKPHVREFLANPTRSNYRNWMKKEGIRPFEPGEEKDNRAFRKKLEEEFPHRQADKIMRLRQERNRLEI